MELAGRPKATPASRPGSMIFPEHQPNPVIDARFIYRVARAFGSQMTMRKLTFILVALCLAASSCHSARKKTVAEANALTSIAPVTQFAATFPGSHHYISYYSGTKGDPLWNSKAGVHGRYVVGMKFKIDFDPTRTHPRQISAPTFYLREISKIERMADGRFEVIYNPLNIRFGINEWDQLVRSSGDLSVLGVEALVDQPVKHFEEIWPKS